MELKKDDFVSKNDGKHILGVIREVHSNDYFSIDWILKNGRPWDQTTEHVKDLTKVNRIK